MSGKQAVCRRICRRLRGGSFLLTTFVVFLLVAFVYTVLQLVIVYRGHSLDRIDLQQRFDQFDSSVADNRRVLQRVHESLRRLAVPSSARIHQPDASNRRSGRLTDPADGRSGDWEIAGAGKPAGERVIPAPHVAGPSSSARRASWSSLSFKSAAGSADSGGVGGEGGGETAVNLSAHCDFMTKQPRPVDVQMLELYRDEKFDNSDGGAWKQGWPITYTADQWSSTTKLQVFVVPHSHNDPGWLKTFEQYFSSQTRHIFDSMLEAMQLFPELKFIWAEVSYVDLWWRHTSSHNRLRFKRLVESGRVEIVTGGWVMPDEAASHVFSLVEQLVSGHEWLALHLNISVNNGWSIDPFGLSPTQAHVLRSAHVRHMLIQRAHYVVKRALARQQQLEFWWRQTWDLDGISDIFCHLMPFYSYDIPHTCGPDPKVCCQFDFLRLPGGRGHCPWQVAPRPINKRNVMSRAALLLDQYRKKSQLYRTNVLLVPLGDDFRYDSLREWSLQYNNYQSLFNFMNQHADMNVQVQFGTLSDYFSALQTEQGGLLSFPSLSGDFFTYADKDTDYWSGYYTSRPFYKSMDRVVIGYLRSAEIMFSMFAAELSGDELGSGGRVNELFAELVTARRWLSLFQHHDGVTGTSKTFVMTDYGNKLISAVRSCQRVLESTVAVALTPPPSGGHLGKYSLQRPTPDVWRIDELFDRAGVLPERRVLQVAPAGGAAAVFAVYNSLSRRVVQSVSLLISQPHVEVRHAESGSVVRSQSAPLFVDADTIAAHTYQLTFVAHLPPYAIVVYHVSTTTPTLNSHHTLCEVELVQWSAGRGRHQWTAPHHVSYSQPPVDQDKQHEWTLQSSHLTAHFSSTGLLAAVTPTASSGRVDVNMQFVEYFFERPAVWSSGMDVTPGAYLFYPSGPARVMPAADWSVRIVRGPISSEVTISSPEVQQTTTLCHVAAAEDSGWLNIDGRVLVSDQLKIDRELAIRFSSSVRSGTRFVTDLNAFQTIERQTFSKLPIQANYYPMSKLVYIEDASTRLSLVTRQPRGCASLSSGQVEVMLDRRLMRDDNRGLGQGVTDNVLTQVNLRLLVEPLIATQTSSPVRQPLISMLAHWAHESLVNRPVYFLHSPPEGDTGGAISARAVVAPLAASGGACDVDLINIRSMAATTSHATSDATSDATKDDSVSTVGSYSGALLLTVRRVQFDCRLEPPSSMLRIDNTGTACTVSNGNVRFDDLIPRSLRSHSVSQVSLTGRAVEEKEGRPELITPVLSLPALHLKTFKLQRRLDHPNPS